MHLPILMYHEVEANSPARKRYSVTHAQFNRHLRMIRERGSVTVTIDAAWCARTHDQANALALTFDDSDLSMYAHALPALLAHGARATFFVVTGFVGDRHDSMSREQIEALVAAGMSVQSHTHTHPFLDSLRDRDLHFELAESKRLLEEWTGEAVTCLSCPGGRYSDRVLRIAAEVGYRAVFTSMPGRAGARVSTRVGVHPRLIVSSATSIGEFERIIGGGALYPALRRFAYETKRVARRMVGNDAYHQVWQRLAKFRAGDAGGQEP